MFRGEHCDVMTQHVPLCCVRSGHHAQTHAPCPLLRGTRVHQSACVCVCHSAQVMAAIRSREWGLLLMDEVHVVPAQMFRKVSHVSVLHSGAFTHKHLTVTLSCSRSCVAMDGCCL